MENNEMVKGITMTGDTLGTIGTDEILENKIVNGTNEMLENKIVNGTDEILEKFNDAEQELVDEMFKKGEVVIHNDKEEIQKRNRFGNKLVLAAGLGLSGYILYKTVIKPIIKSRIDKKRRTQSEVIVEEEKNIEE